MGLDDKGEVLTKFYDLLIAMQALKPNDRSNEDRHWAIAITETEKAMSVFAQLMPEIEYQVEDEAEE